MTSPPEQPEPLWKPWAAAALQHALNHERQACWTTLETIAQVYGADALRSAIVSFADTVIAWRFPPDRGPIGLEFINGVTEAVQTADEVPTAVAWAGQFLTARTNGDDDIALALWNANVDATNDLRSERLNALVDLVVLNLRPLLPTPGDSDATN